MKNNHPKLLVCLKKAIVLTCTFFASYVLQAQPVISSFSPLSGPAGTTITITGSNFSTTASNNVIYIGGVRAYASTASATSITVPVPPGAGYLPISVTVNGLTGFSAKPFAMTFSGGVLTSNAFTFANRLDSVTNIETNDLVSGDFDGDGRVDVLVIDRLNNHLTTYRNNSTAGAVSFYKSLDFTTGTQPISLAAGDVDGDGKPDIVVVNKDDNTVSVFRNGSISGSISFSPKVDFATASTPQDVSLADFDGDGKLDIATANAALLPSYISVLRNTGSVGTISFAARTDIQVTFPGSNMAIGDLNRDGKPDIVTTSAASSIVSVSINSSSTGSISFATAVNYATGLMPGGLVIGDLDGDDKADITLANFYSNTISVFKNTSSGGVFSVSARNDISLPGAENITIADADGDGKPDLVVQSFSPSGFSILKNNSTAGSITLATPVDFPSFCGSSNIITGDFDGDGKPDLGVGCGMLRVGIWKNRTSEPQITSFTPAAASSGATVTISGVNFTGVNAVSFGGLPAASFTVINANTITAVVGVGGTGSVVVSSASGSSTLAGFIITNPPTITSFTPQTASEGTTITITGTNFTGATAVSFGGVAALLFHVVNDTSIQATVGAGASGNVEVTTLYGTASLAGFTFKAPPTITYFSPVTAGKGATINIGGTNFTTTTAVSFGGVPAHSFVVNSSTSITAIVGTGASGDVTVTNIDGTATRSGFTYVHAPVITSFTPDSASNGTSITIKGTHLSNVNAINFGGVPALSYSIQNDTELIATVGNGASGDVTVMTPYDTVSLAGFKFLGPPVIDSFSPSSGPIGTEITIYGKNFMKVIGVYVGGMEVASYTVESPTVIRAVTGIGNSGNIQVSTDYGWTLSAGSFTFLYPQPAITSFSPTSATTGQTVTIKGTGFVRVYSVAFGNVLASNFVVNGDTSITATVGKGATGEVYVGSFGGSSTVPGFTFITPPPAIERISPGSAGPGTTVTITGTDFINVSSVQFGGVNASSFVVNSDKRITAIVGAGASGSVTVTTATGSTTSGYFVYDNPVITSISPTTAAAGTPVTITGSGLINVYAVRFGGVAPASVTSKTDSSITAIVGQGNSGDVTVLSQAATGRISGFTYLASAPAILSVAPGIATAGMAVKINGYKFTGSTAVQFGGVPAASFVVDSDVQITAVVGAGASGDVSVTTPNGTVTYTGFIYTTAPVITAITPAYGPVGAPVTISGYNFSSSTAANTVYFGAVQAKVLSASATSLVVTVPQGATYQPISVTSAGLTVYSSKAFDVTFSTVGTFGAGSFAPKIDSAIDKSANDITLADLDLDGKGDAIVATGYPDYNIDLIKNQGTTGIVSFAEKQTMHHIKVPVQTKFADLDGDGKLDMIVANGADGKGLSVFRNTSTGGVISFGSEYAFYMGLDRCSVAAGDIDGDGKTDLIVASVYIKAIYIYKNQSQPGTLSFAAPVLQPVSNMAIDIALTDMDFDNKPDIIVGTVVGNTSPYGYLYLLRNTSSASAISFGAAVQYETSENASVLAVADLDGDGGKDVMIANQYLNIISFFRNVSTPGNIELDNKTEQFTPQIPTGITVADLDGNNKPDVLVTGLYNASVSVFTNTSSVSAISFAPKFELATGSGPHPVTVGDVDADGRPDILTGNRDAGTMSIIRNLLDGYFVYSFSPVTAAPGTVVTINGIHFTGATNVSFGGVAAASFTVVNDSTITAIVGNGNTGSVMVTLPNATAALPGFTWLPPAPTISSFTPTTGTIGTVVTITGTNFTGATAVSFGSAPAQSFTVNSATSITAVVNYGETGSVSVITSGGTATMAGFVYTSVTAVTDPVTANSKDLTINPNPGKDIIVINHPSSTRNVQMRFVDMQGRTVKQLSVARNTTQTVTNVADLKQGIYQVMWNDGTRTLLRTFMVLPR